MVPLNTPLQNGQTVEIIAVKEGGPSRDWLNPQLGYLHSARARQKVRAWFNAVDAEENIAAGRAIVEKTLQREGKTSVNLDQLAAKLGFKTPEDLYALVAQGRVQPAQHRAGAPRYAAARARARSARAVRKAQQRCRAWRRGRRRACWSSASMRCSRSSRAAAARRRRTRSRASSRAARACRSTAAIARRSSGWRIVRPSACCTPPGPPM